MSATAPPHLPSLRVFHLCLLAWLASPAPAAHAYTFATPPPPELSVSTTNAGQIRVDWTLYPAVDTYRLWQSQSPGGPYSQVPWVTGGSGTVINSLAPSAFYRLEASPLDANSLLASTLLRRIAYGPTPDELERVRRIGPGAYLSEQLAPEAISEDLPHNRLSPTDGWIHVTATGTGSGSTLYLYLAEAGEGYIDDIQLVAGTVPEVGRNLVLNGDFELPLTATDWIVASNHLDSAVVTDVRHAGNGSLHVVATAGGTTRASAIVQDLTPALTSTATYTLSYWWLPSKTYPAPFSARLSGSGITSSPGTIRDLLEAGTGNINDLRAFHLLNAIHSRKQLLEVLLQFLDNHFVTQYSKTADHLDGQYPDNGEQYVAAQLEYRELQRWREALLNPKCTFLDLLKVSAESPAMIIYLDTVGSKGNGSNIANENYARELLELFTFGVDNGYDQRDIEEMSRIWTGWTIRFVAPGQESNPFATKSTVLKPGAPAGTTAVTDLFGTWSSVYNPAVHSTAAKNLFFTHDATGSQTEPKTYPGRFGPGYAGKPYSLTVPGRAGTNGLSEAYLVLAHLANQPFTQEFISVKLCRLLVHEEFRHGTYDYSAPDPSPEAALVKSCMDAWDSTEPKGQIRTVLRTILESDIFRGHGASGHKVKTPLEFVVSAVRALLSTGPTGMPTAVADGYFLRTPIRRAGNMDLFNRAEPDGFPEAGSPWISAGTLAERLRFVQAYLMPTSYPVKSGDAGATAADPVALVQVRLQAAQQRDTGAVADLVLDLLFAGEGRGNLEGYRQLAVNFLNTADDGITSSPFAGLTTTGSPSAYEIRLRGLVAMLLTTPRFQEQ